MSAKNRKPTAVISDIVAECAIAAIVFSASVYGMLSINQLPVMFA